MKVIITTAARSDLAGIADHIGADNPRRAASFVDELVDRCEDLASMAERFQLVPRFERLAIRRRPYQGYLIFYR
jgi:toxin ParE1/3/4